MRNLQSSFALTVVMHQQNLQHICFHRENQYWTSWCLQAAGRLCPISSGSSRAWGYTVDCNRVPSLGLFLWTSGSLQTPWRLRTAPWPSWSFAAALGGQVCPQVRGGNAPRGQLPGQTEEGGHGTLDSHILSILCPGWCCYVMNLIVQTERCNSQKHRSACVVELDLNFNYCTLCIKVGLVPPQPEGKDAVLLTGVYGVKHHRLPFTLQKKWLISFIFTLFWSLESAMSDAATFPPLTRRSSVILTPSITAWGSLAPARLAKVGRISNVLAISWVTPKEIIDTRKQQQSQKRLHGLASFH